jgi:PTH1 family peptidyl-tRNA hydrolase
VSLPAPTYKLIVGLGNPGPQYLITRHNVGFLVLDAWADEDGIPFKNERDFFSQVALEPDGARLVKPTTYMNESGKAVDSWLKWLNLTPADLLVVVDDVALPLGQIRIRPGGSSGGHNGLKSIETHLGTNAFARVRCGVDKVPPGWALEKWVLSRFRPDEEDAVGEMIIQARLAIESCQREGIAVAMNRFNGTISAESITEEEQE